MVAEVILLRLIFAFLLGAWLFTWSINSWSAYFNRKNRVHWALGGLLGLFIGELAIPVALVTYIILFIVEGEDTS